jgi:hypothetical protein
LLCFVTDNFLLLLVILTATVASLNTGKSHALLQSFVMKSLRRKKRQNLMQTQYAALLLQ